MSLTGKEKEAFGYLNDSFKTTGFEIAWLNLIVDNKLVAEAKKLDKLVVDSQKIFKAYIKKKNVANGNDDDDDDNDLYEIANQQAMLNFTKNLNKACPKWFKLLSAEKVKKSDAIKLWGCIVEANIQTMSKFFITWYLSNEQ